MRQMADHSDVLAAIDRSADVSYSVLTPNMQVRSGCVCLLVLGCIATVGVMNFVLSRGSTELSRQVRQKSLSLARHRKRLARRTSTARSTKAWRGFVQSARKLVVSAFASVGTEWAFGLARPVVVAAVVKTHGSLMVFRYVSCVLGCPYEGSVEPDAVAAIAREMLAMGCYEVSLGDTIGVGNPGTARPVVSRLLSLVMAN